MTSFSGMGNSGFVSFHSKKLQKEKEEKEKFSLPLPLIKERNKESFPPYTPYKETKKEN